MPERLLRVDDIRLMNSAENIAILFQRLGYNVPQSAQPLSINDLELPARSAEAIWDAYLIADQQKGTDSLQVLLFQLQKSEWDSPSTASNRMRSIASSLCKRPSNFLLLGTKDYDQVMLVNPRKSFDAQMNLKVGIRKLLIDRTNPTQYDRDRLEAIAVNNLPPQALYKAQCEAFDVEKLTKKFYQDYRSIFEQVQQVIKANNPHAYFDDTSRLHQFAQRLLGRIMFLYFLQKKGFLAGDRNFLKTQYTRLKPEPEDTDFYDTVLEPLFFDILNRQRPGMNSPWGQIPYLNGGLFDRDYGEDIIDPAGWQTPLSIKLPNTLFDTSGEKGILKFFNSYNFTIAENIQGDEDVAVDPEMLGKVFENLLAAEERGQSGTFYTPRGIVQFMCVESLSRYLADETGMELETIRTLTEFDPELPDAEITKLLTKEQARKLKRALESVKVCDPAVGSGAYPMGMMQVILAVRQAIGYREGETIKRGSLRMSELKRDVIANNLYGVDIKPEAIEIAKLRMWLSMVVDIPEIEDVEPLPNLDYKLMCGNSLISTIHGEQMIPDPTKAQQGMLNVTPVQEAIQSVIGFQQQYFNAQADDRKRLSEQIREAERCVFQVAVADRRQYWQSEQRQLQQDIKRMGKVSKAQTQRQQMIVTKLGELDRIEVDVERGLRSVDFFQWHLHFHEVFQQKGGFDIVIGNPPYVRQEFQNQAAKAAVKNEFSELFHGRADMYTYFYGRGLDLLNKNSYLSYISSNKFMKADYGRKLREKLSNQTTINLIVDFEDLPVFDATTYPSIVIAQKKNPSANTTIQSFVAVEEKDVLEISEQFASKCFGLPQRALSSECWVLENSDVISLIQKLKNHCTTLGNFVDEKILWGVKTGLNDAFVISEEVKNQLIREDPNSARIIKPYLRGRDIKRWHIEFENLYVIYTYHGINISRYTAIYKYLLPFKSRLIRRATSHLHEWYELQQPQYNFSLEFSKPKIVWQEMATYSSFTFLEQEFFVNNKCYVIPTEEMWLLGLLNSQIIWWYLTKVVVKMQGGTLSLQTIHTKNIPIPRTSLSDRQAISALVQKCLDAKGQKVEQWEAEINDRVAHLYNLTPDEIRLIQGE